MKKWIIINDELENVLKTEEEVSCVISEGLKKKAIKIDPVAEALLPLEQMKEVEEMKIQVRDVLPLRYDNIVFSVDNFYLNKSCFYWKLIKMQLQLKESSVLEKELYLWFGSYCGFEV